MTIHEIGENAGKVWQTLNEHGPLEAVALQKNTGLDFHRLNMAIGWLAREGKLEFRKSDDGMLFVLKNGDECA